MLEIKCWHLLSICLRAYQIVLFLSEVCRLKEETYCSDLFDIYILIIWLLAAINFAAALHNELKHGREGNWILWLNSLKS